MPPAHDPVRDHLARWWSDGPAGQLHAGWRQLAAAAVERADRTDRMIAVADARRTVVGAAPAVLGA